MPVELFEEMLEFEVDVVESLAPSPESTPYPRLRSTGQREKRSFSVLILENEYLRVTCVPDLGGRIVSVMDKRTGADWFEQPTILRPESGGPRGVRLPGGIRLEVSLEPGLLDMGSVLTAARETDSGTSIVLMNPIEGSGFNTRWEIALAPDRAELTFNVQVQNRTLQPVPYRPRLALGLSGIDAESDRVNDRARLVGFHIDGAHARQAGDEVILDRFSKVGLLAPRFVDSFTIGLTSIVGLARLDLASPELAVQLDAEGLAVATPQRRLGASLELIDRHGEIFRAPATLHPEHPLVVDFPDAAARVDAIRLAGSSQPASRAQPRPEFSPEMPSISERPDDVTVAIDPMWRTIAGIDEARKHVADKKWIDADAAYERALLFNGDDPLLWWEKGVAIRLSGVEHDGADLSNAHFLSPLEPRLRAESFLALGSELPKEPHAIVRPIAERPELLVEVACAYLEAGFQEEAYRWADEALRHHDAPLLHLLMAWMLLRDTKMAVEAGTHLTAASKLGFRPPYPHDEITRRAIRDLARRFPSESSLAPWIELATKR